MIDAILGPGFREACSDRSCGRFLLNYGIERTAAWVFIVTMLVLTYRLTHSVPLVATVLLVQVLGRSLVTLYYSRVQPISQALVSLAAIVRIAALAALILVDSRSDIWWALVAVGAIAVTSGVTEFAYGQMVPALGPRRFVPAINRLVGRIEQLSAVLGPALAGIILFASSEQAAFAVAVLLAYLSLILVRRFGKLVEGAPDAARWENPFAPGACAVPSSLRVVVTGLVTIAALGMLVKVALIVTVIDQLGHSSGYFALLVAAIGVGALFGPLPVDRLLGHFPASLVFAGSVTALSSGIIIVALGGPLYILIPILVASGMVIVTVDLVGAVVMRMFVPDRLSGPVTRSLTRLMLAGQVGGLGSLLVLSYIWSATAAVVALSLICIGIIGVHFLQAGGFRSFTRMTAPNRGKSA